MAITHRLMVNDGLYKDKTGQEKVRWHEIGVMMTTKENKSVIKLQNIPLNAQWDGWVQIWEYEPKEQQQSTQQASQATQGIERANPADFDEMKDDIPF